MTRRASLLLPLALWILVAGMRMLAPSTLDDKDQPKVAFYTSDIVHRGEWLLQHSDGMEVATKPPLYQWTAAAISLAVGRLNEFTLLLPSLLASLAILFIVWDWGREFGRGAATESYWRRGARDPGASRGPSDAGDADGEVTATGYELACLSALIWAATYHVARLEWTARTDMMVTAFGLGAIWASNRLQGAREAGAGAGRRALWRWTFWGLIALGALTKGQVAAAVALSAVALEAAFRKSWRPIADLWPWFGLPMAAGVFALWFNAAYSAGGQDFWDTLVGNELMARVAGTGERAQNARPIWYFIPVFLGRFLPWSAALALAAPRWWKEGLLRPKRRHPFLALAAWTIAIFLIFSIPKGKRPDYILPAFAPAAVWVAALMLDWMRRGWTAFGWTRDCGLRNAECGDERQPEDCGMRIAECGKKQGGSDDDDGRRLAPRGGIASAFATEAGRRRVVAAVFAMTVMGVSGYFFFGSEAARTRDADRARRFGREAFALIQKEPGPILYGEAKSSFVQFYFRTNQAELTISETARAARESLEPKTDAESAATRTTKRPVYVVTRVSRIERLKEALGAGGPGSGPEPATADRVPRSPALPEISILVTAPDGKSSRSPLALLKLESRPGE